MRFPHDLAGLCRQFAILITIVIKFAPATRFLSNMPVRSLLPMGSFLKPFVWCLVVIAVLVLLASHAGQFLVVDEPAKSDAIVVLAGETSARPAHALELLHQGLAPYVFLDAEERSLIYDERLVDIARRYITSRGESNHVSVCAVAGAPTF